MRNENGGAVRANTTAVTDSASAPDSSPVIAVQVENLRVSYGPKIARSVVLDGVSATIDTGIIYGLLGPSGCGKTTLLKCIMGCHQADLGAIKIFGHPSGSRESGMPGVGVGYMPQDVALHDDLTIEEMLIYFGTLYLMPPNLIGKQINFLYQLFELPDKRQLIGTLSGGQRRRVSFMATVVHKPRLLILDEPTVGVDPALREKIWQYLIGLTLNEKITVIITTHYIEECRRGHKIGFMNKGRIMVEDSPQSLMARFSAKTLEEVLYRICLKRCKTRNDRSLASSSSSPSPPSSSREKMETLSLPSTSSSGETGSATDGGKSARTATSHPSSERTSSARNGVPRKPNGVAKVACVNDHRNRLAQFSRTDLTEWDVWRKRFRALMWRQMLQHKRRPEPLMGRIIVPLIVITFYCACIGGTPQGLKMAVINRENCTNLQPCLSRELIDSFNSYVFTKIPYDSVEKALEDVKTRLLWGFMEIHENFTQATLLKNKYAEKAFDKVANHSVVKIRGDFSGKILMLTVEVTINDLYQEFIYDGLREANMNPSIGTLPIKLQRTIFGAKQKVDYLGVRGFGGPGLIIIVTYSISCALMVLVIVTDKSDGMFERNYAAGVSIGELLASHVITQFFFSSVTSTAIVWLAVYVMEIPCKGSLLEAWSLVILQTLSGAGTGLMVASLIDSLSACAMVCNAILLGSFTLSGVLWPVQCLPYYAKWATVYLPATLSAEALRTIMTRGMPASNPNAYWGFVTSAMWAIFLHALSYKALKFFHR